MKTLLVVGAGLAGAVYARVLAEAGFRVRVVDKRAHVGGNCFDYVDQHGNRVHKYGPHLFHTNNSLIVEWCSRFTAWEPYELRVRAITPRGPAPVPINLETLRLVFDVRLETESDAKAFLNSIAESNAKPSNAAEYLYGGIGRELTNIFFRPYSEKMWGIPLEDLDISVVKRIPLNLNLDDRYFPRDAHQLLPKNGYTKLFENILDHNLIEIAVSSKFVREEVADYDHVFCSGSVDEYFEYCLGILPYRSIIFNHRSGPRKDITPWGITNFTDTGPYTRDISWCTFPQHDGGSLSASFTLEEPCDFIQNNMERYYPVKSTRREIADMLEGYRAMAAKEKKITFIGRCGTYQYLDMHQVINQSLAGARQWISGVSNGNRH